MGDGKKLPQSEARAADDKRREQSRLWYRNNIEKARERRRQYAAAHRAEQKERDARAKAADPERWAARQREYVRKYRAPRQAAARERRDKERTEYLARIAVEGKPCSTCKQIKPLTEFRPDSRYRSGHHSQCKECVLLGGREHTRRRRAWKSDGKVDYAAIIERDGMVCHICGKPIADRRSLEFDHVVPLAKGGAHTPENVRPAHKRCNRKKGYR